MSNDNLHPEAMREIETSKPASQKRWFQLSLRTVLILLTLMGLLLGWYVRARSQNMAIAFAVERGAFVAYDYNCSLGAYYPVRKFDSQKQMWNEYPSTRWKSGGRGWILNHQLGPDLYHSPVHFWVSQKWNGSDKELARVIERLPTLVMVHIEPRIGRESFLAITKLRSLEILKLSGVDGASNSDFRALGNLQRLWLLDIKDGNIGGDDGLQGLAKIPQFNSPNLDDHGWPTQFKYLHLRDNGLSDAGLKLLRGNPNLRSISILATEEEYNYASHWGVPAAESKWGKHSLTGAGLAHLATIPNLESLDVSKAPRLRVHPRDLIVFQGLGEHLKLSLCCDAANSQEFEEVASRFGARLLLGQFNTPPADRNTLCNMNSLALGLRHDGRFKLEEMRITQETYEYFKSKLGPEHPDTLMSRSYLASSYQAAGKVELATTLLKEVLAASRKTLPKESVQLAEMLVQISRTLLEQKNWTEAESLLRESLILQQRQQPDFWSTFEAKSMLGGALLGQKKYSEAEPLLLEGYEGLKQREQQILGSRSSYLIEALDRLIELYTATSKPNELARWEAELAKYPEAASIWRKKP